MNKPENEVKNEVQQLFFEQLAGTLNLKGKLRLQYLLDNTVEAREEYKRLNAEARIIDAAGFIERIEPEKGLRKVHERLGYSRKRDKRRWVYIAVAATITMVFVGFFFLNKAPEDQVVIAENATESILDDHVRLTLDDGTSLALNRGDKGDLHVGDLTLKTSENVLEAVQGEVSTALNTLTVPVKENYQIVLDDGTKVWVNSASSLKFPFRFSGATREVFLEGEAYFEVAENQERPFIVHTSEMDITVHGTHFNVNAYAGMSVRTSLIEGSVSVSRDDTEPVMLSPGHQAIINANHAFDIVRMDDQDVLSWMKGIVYFQDQPLGEMSGIISRWFGLELLFESPEVKGIRITGLLERDDLQSFMEYLKASDIKCELTETTLRVY